MSNPFFANCGPFKISKIFKCLDLKINNLKIDKQIKDVKDLTFSSENDITFFIQKNIKILPM